jgi:hypothetical protein
VGDVSMTSTEQLLGRKSPASPSLQEKIDSVAKYQAAFIKKRLKKLAAVSTENAHVICDYITAEQNEIVG